MKVTWSADAIDGLGLHADNEWRRGDFETIMKIELGYELHSPTYRVRPELESTVLEAMFPLDRVVSF